MSANQFITENHYRSYPFLETATIPFTNDVLVDAQFVLSVTLNGPIPTFTHLTRGTGTTTFTFTVGIYTMTGLIADGAAEDTSVALSPIVVGGEILGYGFIVVGSTASLVSLSTQSTNAALEIGTVRLLRTIQPFTLRVANMNRPGRTTYADVSGEVISESAPVLDANTETSCYESDGVNEQEEVDSVGDVTQIAIPPPVVPVTVYTAGTPQDLNYQLGSTVDTISHIFASGADAQVDVGPTTSTLSAGFNVFLSGDVTTNKVVLNYQLGAGAGVDCNEVLGYSDLGILSSQCVKSINGVYVANGLFNLVAGSNISFQTNAANHELKILVNGPSLTQS